MSSRFDPTRRALLAAGGAGAAALLAACSNEGRGGIPVKYANAPVKLPEHVPYQGVSPDLPGDPKTGLMDGYFEYPSSPTVATSGVPGDGDVIGSLVRTDSPVPPGVSRNAFWQALNERLGSDLKMNIVPAPDWDQKFATVVAGDSLPELFVVAGGMQELPKFLEATAADLTPHLSGSAVKDYPFLANIPTDTWQQSAYNGKIMGIPVPRGIMSSSILYKRTDLLKEKGITEDPASFDEFLALCKELTTPRSNVWALGAAPLDAVRQMLGIPNTWSEKGGRLTRSLEAEQQKEALEATRKMVEAGVVSPDAFSSQATDRKNWFVAGRNYFMMDTLSAWPNFEQIQSVGDSFRMDALRTPGFHGDPGMACAWLGNPTYGISSIRKDAGDRIPTLLRVLDFLAAPFGTEEYLFRNYGVEGVDYDLKGSDPVATNRGVTETPLGFRYLADSPWPVYVPGKKSSTQSWHDAQKIVVGYGVADPTLGLYSETDTRIGGSITGRIDDLTNDILQGRKPVSAWDDGVAAWKKAGGNRIRDELEQARADKESS
ncbi:extracellular solute-binding protein [Brachybacterium kimchii]|uniref:Extracellular solute-binding protein n=1 Tax=Brachybacterium kimchii TaxID=2942909 RepID=A0ABY4N3W5_9MICO|nr:extracellular solute-binding protein [Brachybacterium kimchii]UQN29252.1 extracellular solute-binding protein [Brachybacterium kimchii]